MSVPDEAIATANVIMIDLRNSAFDSAELLCFLGAYGLPLFFDFRQCKNITISKLTFADSSLDV